MLEQQALLFMVFGLVALIVSCLTAWFIGSSLYKSTLLMVQCDHWIVKFSAKVSSVCVLTLVALVIVSSIFHISPEETPYFETLILVMMAAIGVTSLSAIIINGNKKKAF